MPKVGLSSPCGFLNHSTKFPWPLPAPSHAKSHSKIGTSCGAANSCELNQRRQGLQNPLKWTQNKSVSLCDPAGPVSESPGQSHRQDGGSAGSHNGRSCRLHWGKSCLHPDVARLEGSGLPKITPGPRHDPTETKDRSPGSPRSPGLQQSPKGSWLGARGLDAQSQGEDWRVPITLTPVLPGKALELIIFPQSWGGQEHRVAARSTVWPRLWLIWE